DMGRCTFNGDALEENHLEFAHNVPMSGDTSLIGMIYHNAGDYPETGNLYFDCYYYTGPGIVESEHPGLKRFSVNVSPNPFSNLVKFFLAPNLGKIKLSVFDVTGKLVNELETDKPTITWNGRKKDGNLANSGVYFYNISSANLQYQGKVILTR
ncbi:MAG: T9SS type A sorting domain-containing protein, partial [candidate division WOR-3 bacterium]|nr:T9SS type A sorting domain-containing protein [candidate division WOR-3 bacterium]